MRISCFAELTISGCKEGRMDVVEDGTYSFICGEYVKSGAVWTVYSDKGQILFRWPCQYSSCTYLENNYFAVELLFRNYDYSYYYTSTLTIKGIKRDSAHILNCSSSSESAVCELRIIGKLFSNVYKLRTLMSVLIYRSTSFLVCISIQ